MKCFFLILVLFFSFALFGATYKTQIHSIERGYKGEPHLILLMDGHVAFLEKSSKSLLDELQKSLENEEWIEVTLDEKLNLVSYKILNRLLYTPNSILPTSDNILFSYEPSILTITEARSVFKNMRRDYPDDSQCYNRAHIWTYEEFNRKSVYSNKLFLFFTTKYIRAYRYHWWFHVTPMVFMGGTDQSNWRTLDRRYTIEPLLTKTWTNIFMNNNALCPVVYNYSDYRNHQSDQWCYLIPTTMFFWQPRDIERLERTGYQKSSYISSEVDYAYWEAF